MPQQPGTATLCLRCGQPIPWADQLDTARAASEAVTFEALAGENRELHTELERLRGALIEAADAIESWGAYAGEYFQQKWDLQGDVTAARNAAGAVNRDNG
jgi:hypothetical protein